MNWLSWLAKGTRWLVSHKKTLFLAIPTILILAVLILKYYPGNNKPSSSNSGPKPISAQESENLSKKPNKGFLTSKDYSGYQSTQSLVAYQYIGAGQYDSAESVMSETLQNVPDDKVVSSTYVVLASIEKHRGDTVKYKQYIQKVIERLNAEGQQQATAAWEKELNSQ